MHYMVSSKSKHNIWQKAYVISCRHFVVFLGGHFENHPKGRMGPKILSVNISILKQGGAMDSTVPLPDGS